MKTHTVCMVAQWPLPRGRASARAAGGLRCWWGGVAAARRSLGSGHSHWQVKLMRLLPLPGLPLAAGAGAVAEEGAEAEAEAPVLGMLTGEEGGLALPVEAAPSLSALLLAEASSLLPLRHLRPLWCRCSGAASVAAAAAAAAATGAARSAAAPELAAAASASTACPLLPPFLWLLLLVLGI